MPVPSLITDLSTTAASNSPAGSDNTFPDLDNFLRAHAAFIAQNYANKATKAAPAFTGQAEFAGGTTAAPSITFTGDLNTGFYSPSADAIAATTGAATRLYIGSDGRVSISPAAVAAAANTHMLVDRLSGSSLPALTAGTVLTLAGSTAAGSPAYMQLISGNASTAEVRFGDTDAALRGSVGYNHVDERLELVAQGSAAVHVTTADFKFGNISAGNYFNLLPAAGGNLQRIDSVAASGTVNMDLNPMPTDGVSNVRLGVFRSTNTSGTRQFQVFRGDGSGSIDHVLSGAASGLAADFCRNGGYAQFGGDVVLSDALSSFTQAAGYKGSPVVDRNATQNFANTDSGKTIRKTNTTAYTWTIAPDATTDFPIGTWIELLHDSTAGDVTIARGAGVVLMSGTSDTNVTVTAGNSGRVKKVAANRWRYIAY